MKKFIFIIIMFFSLSSCGFSPIYSNQSEINFNLKINKIYGDPMMNKITRSQIKRYENISTEKMIFINIKTNYSKDILSKNKKGEVTNYLIKMEIEFQKTDDENQIYIFREEIKTANMSNKFDFKNYENTIINNFVNSQFEKFILKISS